MYNEKKGSIIFLIDEESEGEEIISRLTMFLAKIAWVHTVINEKEYFFVECFDKKKSGYQKEFIEFLADKGYRYNGCFYVKNNTIDEMPVYRKEIQFEGDKDLFDTCVRGYFLENKKCDIKFIEGYEKIDTKFQKLALRLAQLYLEELIDAENYTVNKQGEKVLFFIASPYPYFCDRLEDVVDKYLEHGDFCVYGFTNGFKINPEELVTIHGLTFGIYVRIFNIIKRMKEKGVICVWADKEIISEYNYKVCFFCHGYNTKIPHWIREKSKNLVGLQTTAYYTHVYLHGKEEYLSYFGESTYKQLDYLVTSEFVKDWIGNQQKIFGGADWNDKILTFGYPKQDSLYRAIEKGIQIENLPRKLKNKKKIVLIVTFRNDVDVYLPYIEKNQDIGFIWRPHPLRLKSLDYKESIGDIAEKYKNLVIDENAFYTQAFVLSDALIMEAGCALIINYLCTGKPVLLIDDKKNPALKGVPGYKEEAWYKACYNTYQKEDVPEFIDMIIRGEDTQKEELLPYRKLMTKHFDGEVVERIYQRFH